MQLEGINGVKISADVAMQVAAEKFLTALANDPDLDGVATEVLAAKAYLGISNPITFMQVFIYLQHQRGR